VIDGSMAGLELLKHPMKIRVEQGVAVDVQGDRANEVLKIINPLGTKRGILQSWELARIRERESSALFWRMRRLKALLILR